MLEFQGHGRGREAVEQHPLIRTTRRTFLAGIAATLAPGPLVAQAQQRDPIRHLGVFIGQANDALGQEQVAAFVQGLDALNWHEGSNLRIDWRYGSGDPALFERYAAELVALGPDVLVAVGPAVAALRRQPSTIPIVAAGFIDPVGQGFVASLAHPGGNVTGFSLYDPPMATKWLQILTQITPPVARVAVLFGGVTAPAVGTMMLRPIKDAAPSFSIAVRAAPYRDDAEIEAMMAGLALEEHGGLLVLPDNFPLVHRDTIVALAARHRLPAVYPYPFFAAGGGLISYSIDTPDQFRRAADYVDRILKGAKPGDLPVQRPTKFYLVINLKTAKALGITVAPSLLVAADEVIE